MTAGHPGAEHGRKDLIGMSSSQKAHHLIGPGEPAEELLSCLIVGQCRILGFRETTEEFVASLRFDTRLPGFVTVVLAAHEGDPLEPATVIDMHALIPHVVPTIGDTQIAPAVVEPIPVDVIDLNSRPRTEN
jgi:hypothetical protein